MADVATDKLFTQIPSPYDGKIHKIFYEVEQSCQVGDVLLEIEVDSEKVIETVSEQVVEQEVQYEANFQEENSIRKKSINLSHSENILASPATRYYAKQHNV